MTRVGVDVGGTFTDLVAVANDGTLEIRKVASTPEDPSLVVVAEPELVRVRLAVLLVLTVEFVVAQDVRELRGEPDRAEDARMALFDGVPTGPLDLLAELPAQRGRHHARVGVGSR